mgnify:FL=1
MTVQLIDPQSQTDIPAGAPYVLLAFLGGAFTPPCAWVWGGELFGRYQSRAEAEAALLLQGFVPVPGYYSKWRRKA